MMPLPVEVGKSYSIGIKARLIAVWKKQSSAQESAHDNLGNCRGTNLCMYCWTDRTEIEFLSGRSCVPESSRIKKTNCLPKIPVISIVDDDRSIRNATDRLVRSLGFIAYTFTSADEFLKSPYVNHTACLIVDLRMPNMTGLELQSALLARGLATPTIFITAYPEDGDRERALEAGAVDFLTKPFDGKTMIRSLSAALNGHSPHPGEQLRG